MNQNTPSEPKKGLTPEQLGACVGATVTLFALFIMRELSRPPGGGVAPDGDFLPPIVMGLLSGVGAIVGLFGVMAVRALRQRKKPGS